MSKKRLKQDKSKLPSSKTAINSRVNLLFFVFAGFLVLVLPLIHDTRALDIALMPRIFALSVFLAGISLYYLLFAKIPREGFGVIKNPVFILLIVFLLITIIAQIFSFNFREGFFDLVKTTAFIGLILFAVPVFTGTENWQEKIGKMVVIAAFVAVAIGTVQYIREVVMVEARFIRADLPTIYNVKGLMGHKNEYSNSLMLMLPFLGFAVYSGRKYWRVASITALVMVLTMIFLLKTRAVWMGIIFAGFSATILSLIFAKQLGLPQIIRNSLGLSIIAGVLVFIVIALMPAPADPFSPAGRIKSMTDFSLLHNVHRIKIWQGTIDMVKDHPITGVGPGNWRMKFQPYVKGSFSRFPETIWIRPHNDYLWIAAEKGIPALIVYLTIFALLFYSLLKVLIKNQQQKHSIFSILLFGGLISYLTISFFSFPYERINHQVFLGLMAASVIANHSSNYSDKTKASVRQFILPSITVMFLFGSLYGFLGVKQEINLHKSIQAEKAQRFHESMKYAEASRNPLRAIDPLSNPTDYYISLSWFGLKDYEKAIRHIDNALVVFPENISLVNRKAIYHFQNKNYSEAEKYFSQTLEYLPLSKDILLNLSTTYFYLRDYQNALECLLKIPRAEKDDLINRRIKDLEGLLK